MDHGEVLTLILQTPYFVLLAPRQGGETSALFAVRNLLNGGVKGFYR